MNKIIPAWFLLIATCLFASCSDDEDTISLCNCQRGQYCVDTTCYDMNSDIVPAPEE